MTATNDPGFVGHVNVHHVDVRLADMLAQDADITCHFERVGFAGEREPVDELQGHRLQSGSCRCFQVTTSKISRREAKIAV